jgi:hypothetical protein
MQIPSPVRKLTGRLTPIWLCQSIQTNPLLKLRRTNRVSTGKCGSLPCRRRKSIHGLSTSSGNCSIMIPTRSVCSRTIRFRRARRSLSVRCCIGISSRSRTIPVTGGGRANHSEAGFRHCRPTIRGCAAFCNSLAGRINYTGRFVTPSRGQPAVGLTSRA